MPYKENDYLKIIGLDFNEETVKSHKQQGRNVIHDDATDSDLWEKISTHSIDMAILTMTSHSAIVFTLERLKDADFQGNISATSRFSDDLEELKEAGVSYAYDLYAEAGLGFANDIYTHLPIEKK